MLKHESVQTISSPEFINLQPLDINPLMSACEIKVLYIGQNRNGSSISKEVATNMAKTLRGAPIVGCFKEDKGDFIDHGEQIVFENGEIKVNCLTKPYGFVSPDAKVWFKTFDEHDEWGNPVQREYLMTTGYLWTGQFEECQDVIDSGRPHSMELDEKSLDGYWAKPANSDYEFFIINDATFSKLCILGNDVEPCFEGSGVTAPSVSTSFSALDKDFTASLYTMMKELRFALQGGLNMELENEVLTPEVETPEVEVEEPTEVVETEEIIPAVEEETDFVSKDDDKEEEPEDAEEESSEEGESDEEQSEEAEDEDEKKRYELLESENTRLQEELTTLQEQYSLLEQENQQLTAFKVAVENKEKKAMIDSFYMLSDEDKQDVITHISEYSLNDIESKLSVICYRKRISFAPEQEVEEKPTLTYSLHNDIEDESVPAWIQAVKAVKDNRK